MSTQTIHFGADATEYPLNYANGSGSIVTISIPKSDAVTAEAVYTVVAAADSYTITTDGTAGESVENVALSGPVGYDGGSITFSMRKKSPDEIQREQMRVQTVALGQQIAALTLSDAEKSAMISQLGSQLVQAQLDLAALKGGAAS